MICPHCRAVLVQDFNPPAVCSNCGLSFIEMVSRYRRELIALWVWLSAEESAPTPGDVMTNVEAGLRNTFADSLDETLWRVVCDMERAAWVVIPQREETV